MKTRIIKNSEWKYMVQRKYWYRPFWIDDTRYIWHPFDISLEYWSDTYNKAKKVELEFHRNHNYKKYLRFVKQLYPTNPN